MEKDNKVVLGAVLILLVGMLSFNFAGSLTGKAVNKGGPDVVVTASPSNVYFSDAELRQGKNQIITLTVNVNEGKINKELFLYKDTPGGGAKTSASKATLSSAGCRSSNACQEGTYTITYMLNSGVSEGDYFFRVARPAKSSTSSNPETFDSNKFTVTHYTSSYFGE